MPGRTPEELVERFADPEARFPTFLTLQERGAEALPAVRNGLSHQDWQVRRWCAIYLDHNADVESLHRLLPLLDDPKSAVRLWAVHSISCDTCKADENPIDVVPLLLERIACDESIRVRRMATAMLAERPPDSRALEVLRRLSRDAEDRKLKLHADRALERYAEAGLT